MVGTIDQKFETIAKGQYCEHNLSAEYVIKDLSKWQRVWNKTNLRVFPEPVLSEVDFSTEMVLGVYLGQRSSGGYSIEISRLIESDDSLEVQVTEKTLGPMGGVTMVLTQPYHLVKTARTDKKVKFVR